MRNPWLDLPNTPPFVLPEDRFEIEHFNVRAKPEHRVHLDVLPEPFLGRADAPVVLLSLNPGYDERDRKIHAQTHFAGSNRRCLRGETQPYPFYLLDPAMPSPGQTWWRRKVGALLREHGASTVANRLVCVELFPYHSIKFAHARIELPSQRYSAHLVGEAMKRDATIIIMRGAKAWRSVLPPLAHYEHAFEVRNWQNPSVSPGNCPEAWDRIDAAMRAPVA